MGELLEWLLKKENKILCCIIGFLLTILPLLFFFKVGLPQSAYGHGKISLVGWSHEVFYVILMLLFMLGLILVVAGIFPRRKQ